MIARILRLALVLAVVALVSVLFVYAFLAALIVIPVLGVLFFLFGRRIGGVWVVSRPGVSPNRDQSHSRPHAPPVIDHDPNDLPIPPAPEDKT